jgi:hypothetical protein
MNMNVSIYFVHLSLLAFFIYSPLELPAQAPPQAINYQAVARDAAGNLITGPLGVRISIRSGSVSGPVVYQETHNVVANMYGLFNLGIGLGTPVVGSFGAIDWSAGTYFAQVEVNPGTGFLNLGAQQILSVPYALYAARAATADNAGGSVNITGGPGILVSGGPTNYTISANLGMNDLNDVNTGGVSNGQVLKWNGSAWTPAADLDNDAQTLSFNASTGVLSISGGNSVTLPMSAGGDNWGSQVVQTTPTLSGDGTSSDPLTIAQQGATNGQVLKWNGTTWAPANDVDNDAQTLSLIGNILSISGGNSVTLPSGGDNWGTQVVQTTSVLSGNGTSANPLTIAQQGATNGQVLKWNGSTWAPGSDNDAQTLSISGNTLTISGGNSVTLPSGGGLTGSGTVDYVARFTPNGTTLGNSLIRDNGTGIGINTAPTTSELVALLTGSANSGLRASNVNVTGGSYGVRGSFDGAAYQNAGFLGYNGNITLGTQTVPNAAVFAQAVSGSSGALVATTGGTNTSGASIALSTVWHGVIGWSNYAGTTSAGLGVLGNSSGASVLSAGVAGFYTGTTPGAAAIYGFNDNSSGNNNIGVEGSYNFSGYGLGVAGIGFNGVYPTGLVDIGLYGSVGNNINYSIYGNGNFAIVNGAKSASVGTSKGNQLLYCMESPEVWFEDFGQARLVNGEAEVYLDPLFLETVFIDEHHPMIVTVTPHGNCNGLYVEPGTQSFKVKELNGGHSDVAFSWRVSCKRLHYQDHRFGADLAQPEGDTRGNYRYVPPRPIDYKQAYQKMLEERQSIQPYLTPRARAVQSMIKLQREQSR